jgi:hypothetical protein
MYLDCPPNMLLACPSAADRAAFIAAAQRGDITWHAFPFNSELEFGDAAMINFGLQLTHDLDRTLNQSAKTVLSQRDVPGEWSFVPTRTTCTCLRK